MDNKNKVKLGGGEFRRQQSRGKVKSKDFSSCGALPTVKMNSIIVPFLHEKK